MTEIKNKMKDHITKIRRQRKNLMKGVDTLKYCGKIKLKEDPLDIQKKLRNEWR